MPDGQDQDPTAPADLKVNITDSQGNVINKISLTDFLQQADDDMAQANSIPADATVTLTDGEVMSGAQYRQMVEQYYQTAHDHANQQLDAFTTSMNLCVETFDGLGGDLHGHGDSVGKIIADLKVGMRGVHAAIGNDPKSNEFRTNFDSNYPKVLANLEVLKGSLHNIGDGMHTSADDTFICEKNTLAEFGRTAVDPRTGSGGH